MGIEALIVMALLGKILAWTIVILLAIGFIPGLIIGWFVGRNT